MINGAATEVQRNSGQPRRSALACCGTGDKGLASKRHASARGCREHGHRPDRCRGDLVRDRLGFGSPARACGRLGGKCGCFCSCDRKHAGCLGGKHGAGRPDLLEPPGAHCGRQRGESPAASRSGGLRCLGIPWSGVGCSGVVRQRCPSHQDERRVPDRPARPCGLPRCAARTVLAHFCHRCEVPAFAAGVRDRAEGVAGGRHRREQIGASR